MAILIGVWQPERLDEDELHRLRNGAPVPGCLGFYRRSQSAGHCDVDHHEIVCFVHAFYIYQTEILGYAIYAYVLCLDINGQARLLNIHFRHQARTDPAETKGNKQMSMTDLALCVINEGSTYKASLDAARLALRNDLSIAAAEGAAVRWLTLARNTANKNHRQFGDALVTDSQLLQAAIEIAEYYREQVIEIDTVVAIPPAPRGWDVAETETPH